MKVVKPTKVPVLTRVLERARRPELHVAAMLGFPLGARRVLLDDLAFWAAMSSALGPTGILDEGFAKSCGEVLVAGSFHAPGGAPLPASYVRVKLGPIDKSLAIIGDRSWQDLAPTEPEPMTTMPIDWAHAFGGPSFARNPYGKGAEPIDEGGQTHHLLPNVERYLSIPRSPSDRPDPAGFLPMDVTFAQRRERAGTYDQRWLDEHFPGLAPDAAPTFFNVAPEDQWIDGFFRGDEAFAIENMHPDHPRLVGRLPGLRTRCFVTGRAPEGERFLEIPMRCDTVWLFPAAGLGSVIFHGTQPVSEEDAADIVHLVAACEDPTSPRAVEHYQRALARRLDKDKDGAADLSDSDLMPARERDVAPNVGELDIVRWVKSEPLTVQNLRCGKERHVVRMRAVVEAEGLEPKDYGLGDRPPDLSRRRDPRESNQRSRQVDHAEPREGLAVGAAVGGSSARRDTHPLADHQHAQRRAPGLAAREAAPRLLALVRGFERLRETVLRPAMEEIGAKLPSWPSAFWSKRLREFLMAMPDARGRRR